MSETAFVQFFETYLPTPAAAAVVSKLEAARSQDEFCALAVEAGRAAGYDFTAHELRAAVVRRSAARSEQAQAASGELSDAQLAGAVGGATASQPLGELLGGAADDPASALEHLFDACKSPQGEWKGWRSNQRRVVVLSTDAQAHLPSSE